MVNISLENALSRWGPSFEIKKKRIYGRTSADQRYAITTCKAIDGIGWYKIGLYLEEDHMDKEKLTPYHNDRLFSQKDVNERIEWLKNRLKRVPLLTFSGFEECGPHADYYLKIINFPNDCKTTPEKYLTRGDHVRISRMAGLYTHDAIYIGENKVIHVFGDNKQNSAVREDDWSTFIGDPNSWWGTVSIVIYRLRIRSRDEIVAAARSYLGINHLQGQYDFLTQNCQHFSSYCSTGTEISHGASSAGDSAYQVIYGVASGFGGNGPRPGRAFGQKFDSPLDYEP
ncbi:hypothetical protein I4U23_024451 [Adineta vaga]|nr:hypothetical protein I4U23_024451 [Adineta vaga]